VSEEEVTMPWSLYAVVVTFGIFFFSINVYIITKALAHPWASELWIIGILGGLIGLIYSGRMVRIHQAELVAKKEARDSGDTEETQ
jgi:hypothetical protein